MRPCIAAMRLSAWTATAVGMLWLAACASPAPEPARYRLAEGGTGWDVAGRDRVLEDLRPRYPEFFALILDPANHAEPRLLKLRDDLEHRPADRRNFDALNAIGIAYFEINYRAEAKRGDGLDYLAQSFRSAKLVAVPWRAYKETHEPALRSAILDFFEDAASGEKLGSAATASRLTRIVASLARGEDDPARLGRIEAIVASLRERSPD